MDSILSAAVFFPEKTAAYQSSFSMNRPSSRLVLTLADGSDKTIKVPLRVGKKLQSDLDALPSTVPDALNYVESLQQKAAFSYLVEMLSRRDHSIKEVEDKLSGQGFSSSSIRFAIDKARASRYLDDLRFASYFVDERIRRGWGRIKIEQELRRKGIEPNDVPGYPDEFFDDLVDLDRAIAILSRRSIPSTKPFDKLVRYLMSKGFSYSLARDAVKDRLQEADDCSC